jgi:crossover junction endodeoxyribonuclease RuvC
MSEHVVGIDPGIAGALALVSRAGDLIEVADMPILRDGSAGRASVNAPLLADLLAQWHAQEIICEFVAARPKEGPTGAFSFGRSPRRHRRGMRRPWPSYSICDAPKLKRLIGIPPGKDGAKDRARSEAIRRWPDKAALFARVRDDGRADASLIAIAGLRREGGAHV